MSQTNRPIAPSPAEVQSWLADTQSALVKRRDEILAGAARFHALYADGIPDEEVQGRAADFAGAKGIMGTFLTECTSNRTAEKAPFLNGGRAVDAFFGTLTDPVAKCQLDVRAKMTAYATKLEAVRREAARLEAERLAAEAAVAQDQAIETMDEAALQHAADVSEEAEAAQALADAKPAELSRVRGELGTVVSLRARYVADYERSDLLKLVKAVAAGEAPLEYLAFNTTRINYAIRSEKVRVIPGVVIKEERTVV